MIVIKELQLNRFEAVKIPSARKLFEKFGFKDSSGHPDNTDAFKFSTPKNIPSNTLRDLAYGQQLNASVHEPIEEIETDMQDNKDMKDLTDTRKFESDSTDA